MSGYSAPMAPAFINHHPHNPVVPHAIPEPGAQPFANTALLPWQRPPLVDPRWLAEQSRHKVGLDTVLAAVFGPSLGPEKQLCIVRPHLTRRQRESSEETVDIERPFPIPTASGARFRLRRSKAGRSRGPPPPPVQSQRSRQEYEQDSGASSRSTSEEEKAEVRVRDRHVKRRTRRAHPPAQYDGPASTDNQRRRDRGKRVDVTEITTYKHYCVMCGRSRSKTYHSEHPWGPGIKPDVGVCRRCKPGHRFKEPKEPRELTPPESLVEEEWLSEEEVEEVVVRQSGKAGAKQTPQLDGTSSRQGEKPQLNVPAAVQNVKRKQRRSASFDSLVTMAQALEDDDKTLSSGKHKPVITRRLIYRYVPDQQRMSSRQLEIDQTRITIQENPVADSLSRAGRHRRMSSESLPAKLPSASQGPRSQAAEIIASHPGAWIRGKMIQVVEDEIACSTSSESEPEPEPAPATVTKQQERSISPPEWYFRRYTRQRAPFPPSQKGPTSASHKSSNAGRGDVEDLPPPRPRRGRGGPVQSPPQRPSAPPPPPSASRRYLLDSEDDEVDSGYFDKPARVVFAPGTKRGSGPRARPAAEPCTDLPERARGAMRREEEGLRDYDEAQRDKREARHIRRETRRDAQRDGGAYMELDGHWSVDEDDKRDGHKKDPIDEDTVEKHDPKPDVPYEDMYPSLRPPRSVSSHAHDQPDPHAKSPRPHPCNTFTASALLATDANKVGTSSVSSHTSRLPPGPPHPPPTPPQPQSQPQSRRQTQAKERYFSPWDLHCEGAEGTFTAPSLLMEDPAAGRTEWPTAIRVAEPAGLSIFSRPKGDVEFLEAGRRDVDEGEEGQGGGKGKSGFEAGYTIGHGVNEEGWRETEREKRSMGREMRRRPEMRRLHTDTVVQVAVRKDTDGLLSGSGRSMSMPAVEREPVSPAKPSLPSSQAPEPQLQGHSRNDVGGKAEAGQTLNQAQTQAQVQVRDFAPSTTTTTPTPRDDAGTSTNTSTSTGCTYNHSQTRYQRDVANGEHGGEDDGDLDFDISPGGHRRSDGYARRLRRARRDARRKVRARAAGVEMGARQEREGEDEGGKGHGLTEVYERFRTWNWSG